MATIDDKQFIDTMIANNGHYEDDPQALEICSYVTPEGKTTYHVAWDTLAIRALRMSPFVSDIKVLWEAGH
jgi:hypothetical protein